MLEVSISSTQSQNMVPPKKNKPHGHGGGIQQQFLAIPFPAIENGKNYEFKMVNTNIL